MMKRRIFTIMLVSVLALLLAACGGKNGSAPSEPSGGSSKTNDPASGGSQPELSSPDASLPGGSGADASEPDDASGASDSAETEIKLTLNRTDIELNKAGATFQLRYTVDPDVYDGLAVFTSSDAKVATVDESGTVKAVAPGKATITVKYDSAVATASVSCNWKVSQPAPAVPEPAAPADGRPGAPSIVPDNNPSTPAGDVNAPAENPPVPDGGADVPAEDPPEPADNPPASANVDLSAFYSAVTGKYEFPMPMLADDEILNNFYSGMTGISTEQRLIYICGMSMNTGEFGLVQVKDSKDVDAVKAIFQARIDAQVGGGAWYPMAVESWTNNARVVSNGNYVMMVVHENCDDIVKEFNALF